jgi:hypothetical protein
LYFVSVGVYYRDKESCHCLYCVFSCAASHIRFTHSPYTTFASDGSNCSIAPTADDLKISEIGNHSFLHQLFLNATSCCTKIIGQSWQCPQWVIWDRKDISPFKSVMETNLKWFYFLHSFWYGRSVQASSEFF